MGMCVGGALTDDCLAQTGTCYCFPSCAALRSCWPEATGRISYIKLEPQIPVLTGANLEQEQTLSTESLPFKFVMRIEGGDWF